MDGIDTSVSAAALGPVRATAGGTAGKVAAPTPAPEPSSGGAAQASGANLISLLADVAPPVNSKAVEAIRSLIAQGRYPIDSHAIAAKMIALDVPGRD